MKAKQRAVVIHEVPDPGPSGDMVEDMPIIRLEDGQEVPAIWVDRFIQEGTQGVAEYIHDRNAWRFTPDG